MHNLIVKHLTYIDSITIVWNIFCLLLYMVYLFDGDCSDNMYFEIKIGHTVYLCLFDGIKNQTKSDLTNLIKVIKRCCLVT